MANETVDVTHLKTFADFARLVKGKWSGAQLCIASVIGEPKPVKRISFHQNADGGLLIFLHEEKAVTK